MPAPSSVKFYAKPDLFDLRAALYLILDGYRLDSVKDFCKISKLFWLEDSILLSKVLNRLTLNDRIEQVKTSYETECDRYFPEESRRYKILFSSVLGDFLETVPHLHQDNTLNEDDLYFNAYNPHICDVCGEEIEPGEPAFFRTEPCPAVRHRKCSRQVRASYEYTHIEYQVKEIAYHEAVFRFNENGGYVLKDQPGLVIRQHPRHGYSTDTEGNVFRIPRLGEFAMDYISGVEDYELMQKYRPYHVYLEFMLKAIGISDKALKGLGGYKYLLREEIGRERYPEIAERIDHITLSDFMFDRHVYNIVSSEMVNTIYSAVFAKIFGIMGILVEDGQINYNGIQQSYSINDDANDTDISISIDKEDIICVDFEKSLPFESYFPGLPEEALNLLKYCRQFGVDV